MRLDAEKHSFGCHGSSNKRMYSDHCCLSLLLAETVSIFNFRSAYVLDSADSKLGCSFPKCAVFKTFELQAPEAACHNLLCVSVSEVSVDLCSDDDWSSIVLGSVSS